MVSLIGVCHGWGYVNRCGLGRCGFGKVRAHGMILHLYDQHSFPPHTVACTTTEESLVTLRVECQVVSVFDTTTTCSYDGLPSETCMYIHLHTQT